MNISVCIPTFNQGLYLEQCIKSVLYQTMQPFEIFISNDNSTDNTKALLDSLVDEFGILKIIHQPRNLGLVNNVNYCFKNVVGEYVIRLDSDDYLFPKYIETLCQLLKQYPQAGYAHASVQEIDQYNNKSKIRRLFRKTGFYSHEEALISSCSGYQVAANIIMFRRSAIVAAGYIKSNVNFAEDYYLSVEIANAGFGNAYTTEILSCYRVWTDKSNTRQKRKLDEIDGIREIFDEPLKSSFVKRGWDLDILNKKKIKFACTQSNCLTWDIYNQEEKRELEAAIFKLSSSNMVKLYVFLYKNGFGKIILYQSWLIQKLKQVAKKIVSQH